jgi:hypothetical protein
MSLHLHKALSLSSLSFFYHTRHSSSCLCAFSMTDVLPADSMSVCHTVCHSTSWAHIYAKSYLFLHCTSSIIPDTLHPVYMHFLWLAYSLQTVHQSAIQSATPLHEPIFMQSPVSVFTVLLISHQTLFILSMCIFHDWRTPCRQYIGLLYSLPLHFMSPYLRKVLSLSSLSFFYHTRHSSSCLCAFSMTGVLPADSMSVCHIVCHSAMSIFHNWCTPCRQYVSLPYSLPLQVMSPYSRKVLSLSSLFFFYHTRHSSSCLCAFSITGVLPVDSMSVYHTVCHSTSWAHIHAKSYLCLHCSSSITLDTLHPVYVHFL